MTCHMVLLALVRGDGEVQQMALLPPLGRWWVPRRGRDQLNGFGSRRRLFREEDRKLGGRSEIVRLNILLGLRGSGSHDIVVDRRTSKDALRGVGAVSGGTDQLPDPNEMDP